VATDVGLTLAEVAQAAGITVGEADRLARLGYLQPRADASYLPSAIQHARLALSIERSGIALDSLVSAMASGRASFDIVDRIFPEPARLADESALDLARRVGLDVHTLQRLYLAFGLPQPTSDQHVRVDDARVMSTLVTEWAAAGAEYVLVRLARAVGMPMRQVAEAGLGIFDEAVVQPLVASGAALDPAVREQADAISERIIGAATEMILWLFRRHLEEALLAYWVFDAEEAVGRSADRRLERAIAFVDLTGFTALTETTGDAQASRVAEHLTDLAEKHAGGNGGRVVKLLGDAVMLYFVEAGPAVRCALELIEASPGVGLDALHAGVAMGPVVERDGDYFGHTVNLAARLAGVAAAGQVLVSDRTAEAAASEIAFETLEPVSLRGISDKVPIFLATGKH
jgi:adenylate cyclase